MAFQQAYFFFSVSAHLNRDGRRPHIAIVKNIRTLIEKIKNTRLNLRRVKLLFWVFPQNFNKL